MASSNVNQRIAQLIQQLGITKNAFALSLGKTASVIQHLVEGRNKPGYDLLFRIFEVYPNVSRDWLILGRGPGPLAAPGLAGAGDTSADADEEAWPELPLLETTPHKFSPASKQEELAGAEVGEPSVGYGQAIASAAEKPSNTASVDSGQLPPIPSDTLVSAPPFASASDSSPASSVDLFSATAQHIQYLQHQLALAELRNQHLLEQQKLLREMLDMARQYRAS